MSILAFLEVAVILISAQAWPNVHVGVYYESQCDACSWYFRVHLKPTAEALANYMETHLVPYGNARTYRKGDHLTIQCQHGIPECLLNKIHACALARMSEKSNLEQVIMAYCLLQDFLYPRKIGAKCCSKFGLSWSDVSKCATGTEGTTLLDGYGNETERIQHIVKWPGTPAVTINGQLATSDNLKKIVCETLAKEGEKPPVCNE